MLVAFAWYVRHPQLNGFPAQVLCLHVGCCARPAPLPVRTPLLVSVSPCKPAQWPYPLPRLPPTHSFSLLLNRNLMTPCNLSNTLATAWRWSCVPRVCRVGIFSVRPWHGGLRLAARSLDVGKRQPVLMCAHGGQPPSRPAPRRHMQHVLQFLPAPACPASEPAAGSRAPSHRRPIVGLFAARALPSTILASLQERHGSFATHMQRPGGRATGARRPWPPQLAAQSRRTICDAA